MDSIKKYLVGWLHVTLPENPNFHVQYNTLAHESPDRCKTTKISMQSDSIWNDRRINNKKVPRRGIYQDALLSMPFTIQNQ